MSGRDEQGVSRSVTPGCAKRRPGVSGGEEIPARPVGPEGDERGRPGDDAGAERFARGKGGWLGHGNEGRSSRRLLVRLACWLVMVLALALSLGIGTQAVGPSELGRLVWALWDHSAWTDELAWKAPIIWAIRLPRACVAALCGGALGLAGVVSQGLFRNSLASPMVLGTTSGATLFAVAAFYGGLASYGWYVLPLAASLGAFLATACLFLLLGRGAFALTEHLLLVGFALSSFLGALTSFILSLALAEYEKAAAMMHWMLGGFSGRSWQHLGLGVTPLGLGAGLAFYLGRRLDLLAMGEEVAETLGVGMASLRQLALLAIALLVGASVCMAGALPFIGLVVPHLTRALLGPHHRPLMLYSALNGVSLTLLADLLARTLREPMEIEVGVLTALVGAPFFLLLLWRRQRSGRY